MTSDDALRIGGNSVWGEYFKGLIDEVRIYNQALTASQIQADLSTPVTSGGGAAFTGLAAPALQARKPIRRSQTIGKRLVGHSAQGAADAQHTPPLRRAGASWETWRQATEASATQPHLIEAGEVQVTSRWQRIDFSAAFADPVVVANAMSTPAGGPAVVRIRRVGPTGFDMRLQPWHDAEGEAPSAVVGFLALERGAYTLADGTLIEAGSVVATRSGMSPRSDTILFSRRFNAVPVVMTALTSFTATTPAASRLQIVGKNAWRVRFEGEADASPPGAAETLSYIAWEPSTGMFQGVAFEVQRASGLRRRDTHSLTLLSASGTPPMVLAQVQGASWDGPRTLRLGVTDGNHGGSTFEAESGGRETLESASEVVGYIALQ
jgi:hypothetical protein